MKSKHQLIMDSLTDPIAHYLLEVDEHPEYIPVTTRLYLIEQAEGKCAICGKITASPHIDHRTPIDRGGRAYLDNLQVLCQTCNLIKSNHYLHPDSYIRKYPIVVSSVPDWKLNQQIIDRVLDEEK